MNIEHLKGYIKRKLGYPVINIEIDDTQLSDAINDAFEMFSEFHVNGTDVGYIFLDLVVDQQEYTLGASVYEVLEILGSNVNITGNDDQGLLLSPFYLGNAPGYTSNLIDVEIFRQNFANFKNYFSKELLWEFNHETKKLTLHEIPTKSIKIALKVYIGHIDPSTIYGDFWFKKYCVSLAGIQWATNLSKYEGGKLPGGVNFNAATLEERYTRQKLEAEEELYSRFIEPPDPQIG